MQVIITHCTTVLGVRILLVPPLNSITLSLVPFFKSIRTVVLVQRGPLLGSPQFVVAVGSVVVIIKRVVIVVLKTSPKTSRPCTDNIHCPTHNENGVKALVKVT